jgi:hexokinase
MTDDFLQRNGLHPDGVLPADFTAAYIAEMETGLRGESASLLMLPTYLPADIRAREGETAVVVDIGGTNLRVAVLTFKNGRFEMTALDARYVPGLTEELTKDDFFMEIARRMLPFVGETRCVGICFSHAAEILPDLDGRLISFSKEIKVRNAGGVKIARELSGKLNALGARGPKTYTVLNDTTAALLGGAALAHDAPWGALIGFVLGTGMNLSYIEKTGEFRKLSGEYAHETMIVNTETGNFSAMTIGPVDRAFDETTADPESHRLEKMIGGRYLGDLILFALKCAAREGLLSEAASFAISSMDALPTQEVGAVLTGRRGLSCMDGLCPDDGDRYVVMTVTDRLFERAAKLSALAVSSVLAKTNAGLELSRPALIVAEGSTINKQHSMKDRFMTHMNEQAGKAGRYFTVLSPEHATLYGTALASFRSPPE